MFEISSTMDARIRQKYYQQKCLSHAGLWPYYVRVISRFDDDLDTFHARFVDCLRQEITREGKSIGTTDGYVMGFHQVRSLIETIKAKGGVPPGYLRKRLQYHLLKRKRDTERLLLMVQFSHCFGEGNWRSFWKIFQHYKELGLEEVDDIFCHLMTNALRNVVAISDSEKQDDNCQSSSRLRYFSASRGLSTSSPEIGVPKSKNSAGGRVQAIVQLIEKELKI